MSAEPLPAGARVAPAPPRPAGVADLARYRGRTGRGPAVVPPPDAEAAHSRLTGAPVAPAPLTRRERRKIRKALKRRERDRATAG